MSNSWTCKTQSRQHSINSWTRKMRLRQHNTNSRTRKMRLREHSIKSWTHKMQLRQHSISPHHHWQNDPIPISEPQSQFTQPSNAQLIHSLACITMPHLPDSCAHWIGTRIVARCRLIIARHFAHGQWPGREIQKVVQHRVRRRRWKQTCFTASCTTSPLKTNRFYSIVCDVTAVNINSLYSIVCDVAVVNINSYWWQYKTIKHHFQSVCGWTKRLTCGNPRHTDCWSGKSEARTYDSVEFIAGPLL